MANTSLVLNDLAFKVVEEQNDRTLRSTNAKPPHSKIYKLNEWTVADLDLLRYGFGLAVFDSYNEARSFKAALLSGSMQIFLVEVRNIVTKPPLRYKYMTQLAGFLSMVKSQQHIELDMVNWPDKTVLVESVKLLERVD